MGDHQDLFALAQAGRKAVLPPGLHPASGLSQTLAAGQQIRIDLGVEGIQGWKTRIVLGQGRWLCREAAAPICDLLVAGNKIEARRLVSKMLAFNNSFMVISASRKEIETYQDIATRLAAKYPYGVSTDYPEADIKALTEELKEQAKALELDEEWKKKAISEMQEYHDRCVFEGWDSSEKNKRILAAA